MTWKKILIWFWPMAVLPSMMTSWILFYAAFLRVPATWWEIYRCLFFSFAPYYTAACFLLFIWSCLGWLRHPRRETFIWTFVTGWGLLGIPGLYMLFTIYWNLNPFGTNS